MVEFSQLSCNTYQLTGFYMIGTRFLIGLNSFRLFQLLPEIHRLSQKSQSFFIILLRFIICLKECADCLLSSTPAAVVARSVYKTSRINSKSPNMLMAFIQRFASTSTLWFDLLWDFLSLLFFLVLMVTLQVSSMNDFIWADRVIPYIK